MLVTSVTSGFQPGGRDPQRVREPLSEESRVFYVHGCVTFALSGS